MVQIRFQKIFLSLILIASTACLPGFAPSAAAADSAPKRLRVLCYNIQHGRGTDGRVDLERLAAVIREVKPDLVALQEVDHKTERTGRVDQTGRLAELTGLTGRFARQIDFEGGEYGQAFLSRFPVSEVTINWLPGRPERQRRIAPAVSVDLGGRKLTFVSTHLHHADATFREEQAEELNRLFAEADDAVIIAGDLNARPDSPPLAILGKHWKSAFAGQTDAYTFPADKPDRQIDYVLYRAADGFRVKSAKVLDEPLASDHRPLLAEFEY